MNRCILRSLRRVGWCEFSARLLFQRPRSWRLAIPRNPRVLILDEATSTLTAADVAKVFVVLKRLRAEGLALLYISHRMHEIAELADQCTVFRNGRNVATYRAGEKSDNEVVELMIGREYSN